MSALPSVGTGHALDEVRALELIFADVQLPCRGAAQTGCLNNVGCQITCSCDDGFGQLCGQCAEQVMRDPRGFIVFSGEHGCGHMVRAADCAIRSA